MSTQINLDVPRTTMIERAIMLHREVSTAPFGQQGKYRIKKWPGTQSITLQPVNQTPDFTETPFWEHLKFRLDDLYYEQGFWREVAENTKDNCDFFYHAVVPKGKVQPKGESLLGAMTNIVEQIAIDKLENQQNGNLRTMLRSKQIMPANTAYCLRFHIEGRNDVDRGSVFQFFWGQFALNFDTNGEAHLWQTLDNKTYALVYAFRWAGEGMALHGTTYRLVIFPHAQNKIEFMVGWGSMPIFPYAMAASAAIHTMFGGNMPSVGASVGTGGLYTLPAPPHKDANGDYHITDASAWTIRASTEFRPFIQVSQLGFFSGKSAGAFWYDHPLPLDFAPTNQIFYKPDADLNGGELNYTFLNFPDGTAFVSNGVDQTIQLKVQFVGINDLLGGGGQLNCSSKSPELYGYSLDKPPVLSSTPDETFSSQILPGPSIDFGDAPESTRLNVGINNSEGQLVAFEERGFIPMSLTDPEQQITLFEGTSIHTTVSKAPADKPNSIRLEVRGMVDRLLRHYPFGLDFTVDPYDDSDQKRAWHWQGALLRCFESVGFDPQKEVVIETPPGTPPGKSWDFRLWNDGDTGGSGGKSGGAANATGQRWMPNPRVPIYQFVDSLIRDTMGWNWVWDTGDHAWHVYRRPDPAYVLAQPPLARYYSNVDDYITAKADGTGIPTYMHSGLEIEVQPPACTTLIGFASLRLYPGYPVWLMERMLSGADASTGTQSPYDPLIPIGSTLCARQWDNPKGYYSPNNVAPDKRHADWMDGSQHFRFVDLTSAPSREAFEWVGRRAYEDNCLGYVFARFVSDWGDVGSYRLRKWDSILIDGVRYQLHKVEPQWSYDHQGLPRRASFIASKFREDAPPPR